MRARVLERAGGRCRPARTATRGSFGAFIFAALVIAALSSCVGSGRPVSRPGSEGMTVYSVGRLSFEAPTDWDARGDSSRLTVQPSDERVLLEVRQVERPFGNERECLRNAETVLARGAGELRNVRRHPTKFAGQRAVTQEADQGPWHGWAYAVCEGGIQYRLFFSGRTPVSAEDLAAWRKLTGSAQLGAVP